jgi:hypothetical protein
VKRKLIPTVATALIVGAVSVAGSLTAGAGQKADTIVTIKAEGSDLSGVVKSPRPKKCAKDRKVTVFKQKGASQNPKVDEKLASDTASLNGDRYEWNTGNTGESGKFYARVAPTEFCKKDTSRTVTVAPLR